MQAYSKVQNYWDTREWLYKMNVINMCQHWEAQRDFSRYGHNNDWNSKNLLSELIRTHAQTSTREDSHNSAFTLQSLLKSVVKETVIFLLYNILTCCRHCDSLACSSGTTLLSSFLFFKRLLRDRAELSRTV